MHFFSRNSGHSFVLSLSFLFIFFIFAGRLDAQNQPTAVITEFTFDNRYTTGPQSDEVYRLAVQYLHESGRFSLVEREKWEAINKERELQKREDFIDGLMVEQGRSLGAQNMFFGHVINVAEGVTYATIQLAVVDVATGKTIASEVLSTSGRKTSAAAGDIAGNMAKEENKPLENILGMIGKELLKNSLQKNIADFLNEHFPLKLFITRYIPDGNEISEIWLYGQKNYNFKKNEAFQVIEETSINNPDGTTGVRKQPIAQLKVKAVEGDYAICKVSKGGDVLFDKQGADNIVVESK